MRSQEKHGPRTQSFYLFPIKMFCPINSFKSSSFKIPIAQKLLKTGPS
jgi:hypothetical protein